MPPLPAISTESTASEPPVIARNTAPASDSQPFDFIRNYIQYADIIEAPPEAHEAVATQLIATVLNPNVHIVFGGITVPLDLWVLLLSGSGLGRNTLVSLAHPVVEAATLSGLILNSTWGSKSAFYQNVAENPTGLYVWPELGCILRNLADSRFAGIKEWLTDRYDNSSVPEPITYRTTGRRSDTPPISFNRAPRLNILATSSFDWFTTNLAQEDSTGGFVPRWMLTRVVSPTRVVPIPRVPNSTLIRPLGNHLSEVGRLGGQADISAVSNMYESWYRQAHGEFQEQPNPALAMPFFNRLRSHVIKLALVYHVSQTLDLRISTGAMRRAIEKARHCQETIFALLPTGLNREGTEVDRIAERIRLAGPNGLSRSEFTRAFQYVRGCRTRR